MAERIVTLIAGILALVLGAATPAAAGLLDALDTLGGKAGGQREFLPPDQAFVFTHETDSDSLDLGWEIAPGYYLYRDKLAVDALASGVTLGPPSLPASEPKDDPGFGRVQIYRGDLSVQVPVALESGAAGAPVRVRVTYQGCAEDGICYPPIKQEFDIVPASAEGANATIPATRGAADGEMRPAADRIAAALEAQSWPVVVASFFVFGLLLSFTPCVLPMVPILSGIIVGQHQPVTVARSLALSVGYVAAMAGTYALAGVVAGLLGRNLQASFQHPAVLVAFSAVFVLLALSMFGFFHLEVPARLRARLSASGGVRGGFGGAAAMGALSAVVVGPCVAPPLAGALLYLGHQGSPWLGGLALFAMGLGMGVPLLLIGASAGHFLPRAGAWTERVKQAFGVIFLGVAIWFLSRLLPAPAVLALWATLLIASAIYLGAIEPLQDAASGWQRFLKGMGLVLLCYGVVLIVGAAAGADDPLRPLAPLAARGDAQATTPMAAFATVKGLAQIEPRLAAAAKSGKPVVLDVYADWCIECKHLERATFANADVRAALADFVLLRADVTANDDEDRALLRRFDLYGPPAVLLFHPAGGELRGHRVVGFVGPADFHALMRQAYAL